MSCLGSTAWCGAGRTCGPGCLCADVQKRPGLLGDIQQHRGGVMGGRAALQALGAAVALGPVSLQLAHRQLCQACSHARRSSAGHRAFGRAAALEAVMHCIPGLNGPAASCVPVTSVCDTNLCPCFLCSTQRLTAGTRTVWGGMPVSRATRTTSYRVASSRNTHLHMHQGLRQGTSTSCCSHVPTHSHQSGCNQEWHTKRTELPRD